MTYHDAREQFPALPLGDVVLFRALAAASQPVDELSVTEWAERYRVVAPESGSPWPGPYRADRVPELVEPQDCLHPDHPARRVTARWAAQLGKSTAIENWFGYIVDRAPGSMMIVLPTLEEATKFNRVKLQPTIEASPKIAHRVAPMNSRDEAASTTAFKRFAGGFCQIVNAGSSKGLQMVSIKYLAMDETTGYPKDVDGRGSPRDQARARQRAYGIFAKEWQGSTPGIKGDCAITADFEAGDRRHRYVPCPHCGVFQPLTLDQLRGPVPDKGRPAHIECLSCAEPILDGHKPEMRRLGHWIPTRVRDGAEPVPQTIRPEDLARWVCPPCEGRCREWQPSYHLWAAYGQEMFGLIWERWTAAQTDTTKLRVFYQQDLAEPYDPGGEALDFEKLLEAVRKHPYPRGEVPAAAGLVVSAADVQGYGIKWAVWAIGPGGQRWLIDAAVFEGPPDQSDEPWIALADALQRTYRTAGGAEKGIDLSGVDSGFATERVYRFCRGRANCYALDGRHKRGLPWLGTAIRRDVKDQYKRIVAHVLLYPVGLYDVKTEVMAGLANLIQGPDAAGRWPRSTTHLSPELCDESFAKELTAERLVDPDEIGTDSPNQKKRRGTKPAAAAEWMKLPGRQNDWFDVAVYAFALGWHLEKTRRLTADKWADLLVAVHGKTEEADLFTAAAAAEASGPFAPKPRKARKQRSGGFGSIQ